MALTLAGQVGPVSPKAGDGTNLEIRQGSQGEVVTTNLHGRYYEQTMRSAVYATGATAPVALSANTITLTATSTPILGVWNPTTSGVNLVILQAALQININTVTTPVGAGAFVWAASIGNAAISTGLTPWNLKTLAQAGSQAKGFAGSTALTGLTNNLVLMFSGAELGNQAALTSGTIVGTSVFNHASGLQNFDGSLIVPPGGVLALYNTTSTTTVSQAGRLLWEEVPF